MVFIYIAQIQTRLTMICFRSLKEKKYKKNGGKREDDQDEQLSTKTKKKERRLLLRKKKKKKVSIDVAKNEDKEAKNDKKEPIAFSFSPDFPAGFIDGRPIYINTIHSSPFPGFLKIERRV